MWWMIAVLVLALVASQKPKIRELLGAANEILVEYNEQYSMDDDDDDGKDD
jgi:hypothetical protein